MSYIQLPDDLKKNIGKIQLNVPKNEKVKDLFATLPYLANLKDPILHNRVEDLLKNREDLQKYLLATEDLNNTIEESLQFAVSHGKLNDETAVRHVSERDDPKYNYFRKNDNPLDVVYREQAKYDVQNPIIGSLLKQINKGKAPTYEETKKILDKAPNPKDLDLQDRFNKIFDKDNKKPGNFINRYFGSDDDDDDDDSPPGLPTVPPAPPTFSTDGINSFGPLPPLEDPDPLIRPLRENYFPSSSRIKGRGNSLFDELIDFEIKEPEQINLDGNLRDVFPEADEALAESDIKKENARFADFSDQLDRGEIPEELKFFSGGRSNSNSLFQRLEAHNLIEGNQDFIEYLATDECQNALERDGISIHLSSGDIFINNENTGESLYTFLDNQQNETKKEIPLDFTYDGDLTDYMAKYLHAINEFDEVKYDFLTNKNSKFLFHLINKYQEDRRRPKYPIRHSTLTDDNYALQTLQDRNWPYFISRIIKFFQGFINLNDLGRSDSIEMNILNNTRANFEIVKDLYNELFNSVGINLHEYFKNLGIAEKQRIDTDLTNNNFFTWDPQEDFIQQRILTTYRVFYYDTGRFPGRSTLIAVPRATMLSFINSDDVFLPRALVMSVEIFKGLLVFNF